MDFPVCHLEMVPLADKNRFLYQAEGEPYIALTFDTSGAVEYKRVSDGDIMPDPFLEQLVFTVETAASFVVELSPRDGAVMRKGRGAAILSQQGKPLIYGVNGLYDYDSDTLITWHGFPWHFCGDTVTRRENRDYVRLEGSLSPEAAAVITVYFQYYQKHRGFAFHNPRRRRHNPASICGWASWEAYRTEVNLEKISSAAAFLAENLKPWGLEYIQIDDGYQSPVMPAPGLDSLKAGWLSTNEKFPGGHESIVAAIRNSGFIPGLWTNAAINNEEYAKKSGRCIQGKNGVPLKEPWIGYVFDCRDESLRELEELYRGLSAKGYRYFKVDALRHLVYDGLMAAVREGLLSNEDAIRRFRGYLEAVRRGVGEDNYILSCWGVLSPNAGIADAMRVATDASASTESLLMQTDEAARWHFTHGVLYRNDPDYLCLRMEIPQAKALASLLSLNGYLYMISDDISVYTPEKLEAAQKTMPPTAAVSAETGPLNSDSPMNYYRNLVSSHQDLPSLASGNLWVAHYSHCGRNWAVVQLIRPFSRMPEQTIQVPLAELGLDPGLSYAVFDFWEQKPQGLIRKTLTIDVPEAFGSRVLALTPLRHPLELIGSSRHVSMDLISVMAMNREEASLKIKLKGIPGRSFDYWFITEKRGSQEIQSQGGTALALWQDRYLNCRVSFQEETVELQLRTVQ